MTWVTPRGLTAHSRNRLHLLARRKLQDCAAGSLCTTKEAFNKRINLRKSLLSAVFFLVAVAIANAIPRSEASGWQSPSQASGKIGPSAVWQPAPDFIAKAHAACDKGNPGNYCECFIAQMSTAGAPTDAVNFTRMLYQESDGQVGILSELRKVGPVDVARVMYPLRANDNYGLLLINGDPKILDVDDLKKLDRGPMEQNPMYKSVKGKYPNMGLWPGDRSGRAWPQVKPLPDGGQQFILGYPLINGCHACAHVGLALFAWNFDSSGKFLGTKYVPTPPPPKLTRPNRATQPSPPPPQS